jgi:hypothetical protein
MTNYFDQIFSILTNFLNLQMIGGCHPPPPGSNVPALNGLRNKYSWNILPHKSELQHNHVLSHVPDQENMAS